MQIYDNFFISQAMFQKKCVFFQTIIRQTPVFTFAKPACFGSIMAHAPAIFAGNKPAMTTFYCTSPEEALRRAKAAGKLPGRHYGGITLPSGRKGFAVYEGIKVIEQYSFVQGDRSVV